MMIYMNFISKDIPINNNNETYFEIGTSKHVVFPDDEAASNAEDVEENADNEVLEGRALKQTMQGVTKVDVGVQSQLLVAPGAQSIIYFDVTNLRSEPTYHSFNVQDEKRYLRAMEPRLWVMTLI